MRLASLYKPKSNKGGHTYVPTLACVGTFRLFVQGLVQTGLYKYKLPEMLMAPPQNNQLVLITQQTTIMVAMDKQPVAYHTEIQPQPKTNCPTNAPAPAVSQDALPADRSSMEGKFGWNQFGDKSVPYLFRADEKYVSLKMILVRVYDSYKKFFTDELYGCCDVNIIKMTNAEAKLLNEINSNHCDNLFGQMVFTSNDDLITVKDAINTHHFLHFCYEKLILKSDKAPKICGFIQINRQNCIPYVKTSLTSERLYVPLIYFDGEYVFLEQRSIELQGFPLAFLKLCCKIHGIGKSSFDKKSMAVVDLELVKKFFPPETLFEDSWPVENKIHCLLVQRDSVNVATQQQTVNRNARSDNIAKRNTLNYKRPSPPPYQVKPVQNTATPNLQLPNTTSYPSNITSVLRPIYDSKTGYTTLQIPDYTITKEGYPYFTVRTEFGNKFLYWCINFMPFDSTTLLVTLEEAVNAAQIPMDVFMKAIAQLKFNVYSPNACQKKVLASCKIYRTLGLINVYNFVRYYGSIRSVCLKMSMDR